MMKIISRPLHIVLDLCYSIFLIVYPWVFEQEMGLGSITLLISGLSIICYSMLTKYELGVLKLISFKIHLSIDFVLGVALICAPWVLGFGQYVLWPHVIIGLALMITAVLTKGRSVSISKQEEKFTF